MIDLKQKSIIAIIWNLTERFGTRMIQLIAGVIMARLLLPEDYGLIAMASVFISVSTIFVSGGFGLAYIQKKEVSIYDANTVFHTNIIISIIMYIALWLSAPFISRFYDYPNLTLIIRLMSLSLIINAFSSIQRAILKKEIDFKSLSTANLIGVSFSGLIGVVAANSNMGVYSLIFQQLIGSFTSTVMLWFKSNWRPRWIYSKEALKSLFNFGGWIFLSTLLNKIFDNIYKLFIGKFYPAQDLGFYDKAKNYQILPTHIFIGAVGSVSFPLISKLQGENEKILNTLKSLLKYSYLLSLPISIILIVMAEPLILILLTEKWIPMINYLQTLCIISLFFPFNKINAQAMLAVGKSKLETKLNIFRNLMRVLILLSVYKLGIIYIIFGEVFISVIMLFLFSFYTKKLFNYGLLQQLRDVKVITFAGIASSLTGVFLHNFLNNFSLITLGIGIMIIVYIVIIYFFDKKTILQSMDLLKTISKKSK